MDPSPQHTRGIFPSLSPPILPSQITNLNYRLPNLLTSSIPSNELIIHESIRKETNWSVDSILCANITYVFNIILPIKGINNISKLSDILVWDVTGTKLKEICKNRRWNHSHLVSGDIDLIYFGATHPQIINDKLISLQDTLTSRSTNRPKTFNIIALLSNIELASTVIGRLSQIAEDIVYLWPSCLQSSHIAVIARACRVNNNTQLSTNTFHYNIIPKVTYQVDNIIGPLYAAWDIEYYIPFKPNYAKLSSIENQNIRAILYPKKDKKGMKGIKAGGSRVPVSRTVKIPSESISSLTTTRLKNKKFNKPTQRISYVHSTNLPSTKEYFIARREVFQFKRLLPTSLLEERITLSPTEDLVDDVVNIYPSPWSDYNFEDPPEIEVIADRDLRLKLISPGLNTYFLDENTLETLESKYEGLSINFLRDLYSLLDRYSYIESIVPTLPIPLFDWLRTKYSGVEELFAYPGRQHSPYLSNDENWWSWFESDVLFGSQGVSFSIDRWPKTSYAAVCVLPSSPIIISRVLSIFNTNPRPFLLAISGIYSPTTGTNIGSQIILHANKYYLAYGETSNRTLTLIFSDNLTNDDKLQIQRIFGVFIDYPHENNLELHASGTNSFDSALVAAWHEYQPSIRYDETISRTWITNLADTLIREKKIPNTNINLFHYHRVVLFVLFTRLWQISGEKERAYWAINLQYYIHRNDVDNIDEMYQHFCMYLARLSTKAYQEFITKL